MSMPWRPRAAGRRGAPRPKRYRPWLESLESRNLLAGPPPGPVPTGVLHPDTFSDNNDGNYGPGQFSLREAVILTDTNGQDNTILLRAGTYTLSIPGAGEDAAQTGDLDLTSVGHTLTIRGAGALATAIDGGQLDRVLQIFPGVTVVLADLTVTNGGLDGNGAGISNAGNLTLTGCEVTTNQILGVTNYWYGGGIYNSGTLTIDRSTLFDNVAGFPGYDFPAYGGAIANFGTLTLTNTTISGNSGNADGGGLANYGGTATLVNCTIANNDCNGGSGGGIFSGGGTVTLTNTIVADNTGTFGMRDDVSGALDSSNSYNLIGVGSGLIGVSDGTNNNQVGNGEVPDDPLLGPLQDNGGGIRTQALGSGSPAIDAGTGTGAPTADQRGIPRDGPVDIGAYEFNPYVVTNTNASGLGSLNDAILSSNASGGGHTITFAIGTPGSVQTIQPLAIGGGVSLPVITAPVMIDGWSQGGPGYTGPPLIQLDGTFADDGMLGSFGFNIQADDTVVRGFAINHYADVNGNGFGIGVFAGSNVWIYGNHIGTDPSGLVAEPNGQGGIWLGPGTSNDLIGTNGDGVNNAAELNVIAGNIGDGILVQGAGNTIAGNCIGVGADGVTLLGNTGNGIRISGAGNRVGGAGPDGNLIADNGGAGVAVVSSKAVGNAILENAISGNGEIGIDLGNDGVTPNDPGDADTGPNNLQNFPVLSDATLSGGILTLAFSVPSSPQNSAYPLLVEFFLADASGEAGAVFLGATTYPTGQAQGVMTLQLPAGGVSATDSIVATATDSAGNTSEFSAPLSVNVPPTLTIAGGSLAYTEKQPPISLAEEATVTDADNTDFDQGTLTVSLAAGAAAADRLAVTPQGSGSGLIGAVGNVVSFGGVAVATVAGGGDGFTPLVVTFNANAGAAAVQAVLQAITYYDASDDPAPAPRTVQFGLTDGDGGTSGAATETLILSPQSATGLLIRAPAASESGTACGVTVTAVDRFGATARAYRGTVSLSSSDASATLPAAYTFTAADNGTHTFTVTLRAAAAQTVTAADGASSFQAAATVAVANIAPSGIQITPSATAINVGQTLTLAGTFTDPGTLDTHTVTISWGDGSADTSVTLAVGSRAFSATHSYSRSGAGAATAADAILVSVADDKGGVGQATTTETVSQTAEAPPTVNVGADSFLAVGTAFNGSGSFSTTASDTFRGTVDYGDGSGLEALSLGAKDTFNLRHVYRSEGSFVVTVTVKGAATGAGSASFYVHTFLAGPDAASSILAPPGGSIHLAIPGADLSLDRDPGDTETALILVVLLPYDPVPNASLPSGAGGRTPASGSLTTLTTYDIRALHVSNADRATIVFVVNSPSGVPQIRYLETTTATLFSIQGSRQRTSSLRIENIPGTTRYRITLILDGSSFPTLPSLTGTIFAVEVPTQSAPATTLSAAPTSVASAGASGAGGSAFTFSRTGFVSGSERAVATATGQASLLDFGGGGDGQLTEQDRALVRAVIAATHTGFWERLGDLPVAEPALQVNPDAEPASGEDEYDGASSADAVDWLFAQAAAEDDVEAEVVAPAPAADVD